MNTDIKIVRGQILKSLRKKSNRSQGDVAAILNVSFQAYQKYEYGMAEPTFDALCTLADLYDVSTDYLLGRDSKDETKSIDDKLIRVKECLENAMNILDEE